MDTEVGFAHFGGCDSGYIRFENRSVPLNVPGGQYTWDFGDGNTSTELHPTHVYGAAGMYNVKLKLKASKSCLDDSLTTTVDMASFEGKLTVSPDRMIFVGQTITLLADGPANIYTWTPATALSDPTIPNPKASPVSDITYTVRVSNPTGCFLEEDIKITVVEPRDIYVPTGFTPNNDGKNDLLRPIYGSKYTLEEFCIYNRWGEKIYSTSERWAGWDGMIDGAAQSSGVYVWTLRIKGEAGELIERKGTSVLIR
jgi:gliding motility-associated-like protein